MPAVLGDAAWRGSPACAGIDPASQGPTAGLARLPRMRGDRPLYTGVKGRDHQAPPHARGSTGLGRLLLYPARGSPACAGIDPMRSHSERNAPGLPRMRSTHGESGYRVHEWGSPACAGIDLAITHTSRRRYRLPRMRGDRPGRG